MRWSGKLLPWIAALAIVLFVVGLTLAFRAPPDYQQKETVKIMYLHVPSAVLSMAVYMIIFISSVGYVIWRHPLADVSAKTAAPIGAVFTLLALVTGSLWGKPTWGTYWQWDLRLTSELILFFLYLGLIALRQAIDEPGRGGRATAVLSIIGVIFLPIIKLSVEKDLLQRWFGFSVNTLHQPGNSVIDWSMRLPLNIMIIAFFVLFLVLHLKAMRAEVLRRRCDAIIAVHVRNSADQERASGEALSNV
jgi:heme exporter protein C